MVYLERDLGLREVYFFFSFVGILGVGMRLEFFLGFWCGVFDIVGNQIVFFVKVIG